MFQLKSAVSLALLLLAICVDAFPFKDKPTYVCKYKDGKIITLSNGQPARILKSRVDKAYKVVPASTVDHQGKPYKSGYPHEYGNEEEFTFLHPNCDTLPDGRVRLEFPVIDDAKKMFDKDLPKKQQDSGPYRMIYTVTGEGAKAVIREFCGVVVHIPPENRKFGWCGLTNAKLIGVEEIAQEVVALSADDIPWTILGDDDQLDQFPARVDQVSVGGKTILRGLLEFFIEE